MLLKDLLTYLEESQRGFTDTQEIHNTMQNVDIQYDEDLGGKSLYQLVNLRAGFLF